MFGRWRLWGTVALVCASACGDVERPVAADAGGVDEASPGASPMRRLTRFEYNNTVRDLLGDDTRPADRFPPEERSLGFDNQASAQFASTLLIEHYLAAAEDVAWRAVSDLDALMPCDPTADGEDACARQLIEQLGLRAWRRPLTGDEIDRVYGVYLAGKTEFDFTTGVALAVQVLLQSPHFLYRVEAGGGDVAPIVDWEMASRLSYLLWSSMPDDALFAAAAAGRLHTGDDIGAQVERMLADPRARAATRNFYSQWLGLVDAEPSATRTETEQFVDDLVWNGSGSVTALLTAPHTFMNAELAAYYGVDGPTGDAFERVDLDPARYAGVLTHAGLLARLAKPDQTAPVLRGKFVREQLLCQTLAPPPDNIAIVAPDPDPSLTTRERWAEHASNPACSGCHRLTDPIGFGFEHFDATGRWRDDENGLPIDATGELIDTDVDGPFDGAVELAERLASSDAVYACVVDQYFRWGYGRAASELDAGTVAQLRARFTASGYDLRALIVALTETDAFRYRTPPEAE